MLYLPELMAKAENRKKFPCFLIAPQCRPEKQWVNVPWTETKSTLPEQPSDQLQAAMGMLDDVLEKYPIDRSRVYLTGLSMGGYGCWDAAARWPERFSALAPICGGGDEATAPRFAKLPIWTVHGDADAVVLIDGSSERTIEQMLGEPHHIAKIAPRIPLPPRIPTSLWRPALEDRFAQLGMTVDPAAMDVLLTWSDGRPYPTVAAAAEAATIARRIGATQLGEAEISAALDLARRRVDDDDA